MEKDPLEQGFFRVAENFVSIPAMNPAFLEATRECSSDACCMCHEKFNFLLKRPVICPSCGLPYCAACFDHQYNHGGELRACCACTALRPAIPLDAELPGLQRWNPSGYEHSIFLCGIEFFLSLVQKGKEDEAFAALRMLFNLHRRFPERCLETEIMDVLYAHFSTTKHLSRFVAMEIFASLALTTNKLIDEYVLMYSTDFFSTLVDPDYDNMKGVAARFILLLVDKHIIHIDDYPDYLELLMTGDKKAAAYISCAIATEIGLPNVFAMPHQTSANHTQFTNMKSVINYCILHFKDDQQNSSTASKYYCSIALANFALTEDGCHEMMPYDLTGLANQFMAYIPQNNDDERNECKISIIIACIFQRLSVGHPEVVKMISKPLAAVLDKQGSTDFYGILYNLHTVCIAIGKDIPAYSDAIDRLIKERMNEYEVEQQRVVHDLSQKVQSLEGEVSRKDAMLKELQEKYKVNYEQSLKSLANRWVAAAESLNLEPSVNIDSVFDLP